MSDQFAPPPSNDPGQPPRQDGSSTQDFPTAPEGPAPAGPAPAGFPPPAAQPPQPVGYSPVPSGHQQPGYQQPGPYSPIVGRPLTSDERMWAMLAHLSILALGIIGPIVLMVTKGNESAYIRYHAVEALNLHLTLLIVALVCLVTFFLVVPLLLLVAAEIAAIILGCLAAAAANRGELYRYPVTLRMVS